MEAHEKWWQKMTTWRVSSYKVNQISASRMIWGQVSTQRVKKVPVDGRRKELLVNVSGVPNRK